MIEEVKLEDSKEKLFLYIRNYFHFEKFISKENFISLWTEFEVILIYKNSFQKSISFWIFVGYEFQNDFSEKKNKTI